MWFAALKTKKGFEFMTLRSRTKRFSKNGYLNFFLKMRDDVVAVMAGRSGLGAKHGITLANGIGIIDSDYRGELRATLINNGNEPFKVCDGDRIAQLMFMPVMQAAFIEADELDETERGTGGFGSTGVN